MTQRRMSFDCATRAYQHERRLLMQCCEAIGTPRAQAVFLMAKNECWSDYLSLAMPDRESPTFADDYLVSAMMSKHPHLPNLDHDRKTVAKQKWLDAEASCRSTNDHWMLFQRGEPGYIDDSLVRKVQAEIHHILGPLTSGDLQYVQRKVRFGPGATSSVTGDFVVPSRKFTSQWDVSLGLFPFYQCFLPYKEGFRSPTGDLVDWNTVTFVPKNSKTDRAIAIEPHMNIYVQLGIGALIRNRLRRIGVDLDLQADKNRRAVLRCQRDRRCTIDLSSASDTVAYLTVMNLLPFDWFHLLDIARSEKSKLGDEVITLEKFSSMGNGYTFELETLIFLAICHACGDYEADVFGDDIICRQDRAHEIVTALNTLGFSVNVDKTYLAGTFFESCGVDAHNGVDVRPFFLKGKYETIIHVAYRTANAIRLYAHRRNLGIGCDRRFLFAWLESLRLSSRAAKTYVSYPYDGGIWRDFDECSPSRDKRGWDGFIGRIFSGRPDQSQRSTRVGQYVACLAFGPAETPRSVEYRRGVTVDHRFRTVHCSGQWRDLGAWQ